MSSQATSAISSLPCREMSAHDSGGQSTGVGAACDQAVAPSNCPMPTGEAGRAFAAQIRKKGSRCVSVVCAAASPQVRRADTRCCAAKQRPCCKESVADIAQTSSHGVGACVYSSPTTAAAVVGDCVASSVAALQHSQKTSTVARCRPTARRGQNDRRGSSSTPAQGNVNTGAGLHTHGCASQSCSCGRGRCSTQNHSCTLHSRSVVAAPVPTYAPTGSCTTTSNCNHHGSQSRA